MVGRALSPGFVAPKAHRPDPLISGSLCGLATRPRLAVAALSSCPCAIASYFRVTPLRLQHEGHSSSGGFGGCCGVLVGVLKTKFEREQQAGQGEPARIAPQLPVVGMGPGSVVLVPPLDRGGRGPSLLDSPVSCCSGVWNSRRPLHPGPGLLFGPRVGSRDCWVPLVTVRLTAVAPSRLSTPRKAVRPGASTERPAPWWT